MNTRLKSTVARSGVAASLIGAAFLLSGCMQSTSGGDAGEQSEVYVYKGRIDPLTTEPAANRAAKLSERFKLVQARQ